MTERHESAQPKPWLVSDAPEEFVRQMLGAIVGIEIELTALTGKWKVSQNRSAADRLGVAQGLVANAADDNARAMAALVRDRST